ncbi:hypothetical protein OJAV_G00016690 [Oryzias javanicus]|uniref:HAT C-terminal dimerisation domain-containing protein n=1 Tax=Oryzias javanicus TaxID=123683 RepID=A0A3S2Q0V3_ORYJA|nr:hypothetical protein OJAV_G00016690 [Oryzias javanicus]
MKRAMSQMGVQRAGCVAHLCQLCVHEGLLAQRSVTDTLAIARKIVGHFKHSPLAYSRLEDIQTELNMDIKRLQQDVQTRWNSNLYMLQSLMEQKRPLSVSSTERTLPAVLTANQWDLMKKVADVLTPFEELTREVSREDATAADVIPAITAEPLFYIATLLDPRYKDCFFIKSANLTLAKEHLIQELVNKEEKARAVVSEAAASPDTKAPRLEACSTLDSAFEEILQERQSVSRSVSCTSAEVQVCTSLSEQTIPKRDDPLGYWKERALQFPSMAALAAQYLSAPCSSVQSERLFSSVSNILDENRNRLKSENVEMLVFIKKNIKFIL